MTFLLRCNVTEVILIDGVVLIMGAEYLPMLPAAILYINHVTDGLPALASAFHRLIPTSCSDLRAIRERASFHGTLRCSLPWRS